MSDQPQNPRPLSEIGHLFLSSVRDKQTGGAPRPMRIPPGGVRREVSIDMTPDEFAKLHDVASNPTPAKTPAKPTAQVTAVLGSRVDGVKELARRISAENGRVGLIEVDASEFRLTCFDSASYARGDEPGQANEAVESFEPRRMAEAIEELSWDVHRWLLVLPNPRTPEARALLRQVKHWVLLTTPDHDGVVACYRMLKGLAELGRPALSLALIDADPYQANKVFEKLRGVCQQFLNWDVKREPTLKLASNASVAEHLVMSCRVTRDKAQVASGTPWQVVDEFIGKLALAPVESNFDSDEEEIELATLDATDEPIDKQSHEHVGDVVIPEASEKIVIATTPLTVEPEKVATGDEDYEDEIPRIPVDVAGPPAVVAPVKMTPAPVLSKAPAPVVSDAPAPVVSKAPAPVVSEAPAPFVSEAPAPVARPTLRLATQDVTPEIIELPGSEASATTIISAILSQSNGELVECPLKAPACPEARMAVTRDRTLVLLAVARSGLTELHAISRALNWMTENRQLIAMALPQLHVDAHAMPVLRLLVDHADLSAELLQPLLQSGTVTLHTYRRLKWGGKTGLLVEAA